MASLVVVTVIVESARAGVTMTNTPTTNDKARIQHRTK
jgi:hypothetical protein